MFEKYSSEQVARIVSAVFLVLGLIGYKSEVDETAVVGAIDSLVVAAALLVALFVDVVGYFRRWSKGDVNALGKRL